jgi:hypothetical protein
MCVCVLLHHMVALREIQCQLYSLGGSIRWNMVQTNALSQVDRKRYQSELNRAEELLYKGAQIECAYVDKQTRDISVYPSIALDALVKIVSASRRGDELSRDKQTAGVLDLAARHALAALDHNNRDGEGSA